MGNEPPERMRVKDIISEPGAHELASSPDKQPYLELAKAVLLVGVQEVQRLMLGGYCVC